MKRSAGILLHISSLPSNYGIGSMGKAAFDFIDFLRDSNQSYWQLLPIGPAGLGNSPYTSYSTYAGNPNLIDLDLLIENNLLCKSEVDAINWGSNPSIIDYEKINKYRLKILYSAFCKFKINIEENKDFLNFIEKQSFWLDDYALYMAITEYKFRGLSWEQWPDPGLKLHNPSCLVKYAQELQEYIFFFKFIQYLFFKQWHALKTYANSSGIQIIGDLPIYVPLKSSDVWSNQEEFLIDEDGKPIKISGCPPDHFSPEGQLWGHPIYNWPKMRQNDYRWWMNRIRALSSRYDITRIDHFRAFDSYYSIPNDGLDHAVQRGEWIDGPGSYFFDVLKNKLGNIKIIAEDLGSTTLSVASLLKYTTYPGMKVIEQSFSDGNSPNRIAPHSYGKNSVVYPGTHDNDTIMGWISSLKKEKFENISKYAALSKEEGYNWGIIRLAYSSVCDTCIISLQDILGLGSEARMNIPSVINKTNWAWRLDPRIDLKKNYSDKLNELCRLYDRQREFNSIF